MARRGTGEVSYGVLVGRPDGKRSSRSEMESYGLDLSGLE